MLFDPYRNSKLQKLMIDITDRTVESLAEEITSWLQRSGALYIDEVTVPASAPSVIGIKQMVVAGTSRGMVAASTSRNH